MIGTSGDLMPKAGVLIRISKKWLLHQQRGCDRRFSDWTSSGNHWILGSATLGQIQFKIPQIEIVTFVYWSFESCVFLVVHHFWPTVDIVWVIGPTRMVSTLCRGLWEYAQFLNIYMNISDTYQIPRYIIYQGERNSQWSTRSDCALAYQPTWVWTCTHEDFKLHTAQVVL